MSGIERVLVLAPMTSELKPLLRQTPHRQVDDGGVRRYEGRVGDMDVVMTQIGVGPPAAEAATRRALAVCKPDHVLVSGIAGGLAPECAVGSVVVPDTVVDVATGRRFTPSPFGSLTLKGTVGVADHLITDQDRLTALEKDGVGALEMESTGVAIACEEAGVPWTTVRVIGDRPDGGLTDGAVMTFLREDGTTDTAGAIRFLLTHPRRIPGLLRLGQDSAKAASKAARVTLGAVGGQS